MGEKRAHKRFWRARRGGKIATTFLLSWAALVAFSAAPARGGSASNEWAEWGRISQIEEPEEGLRLGTNGVELIANAPHPNAAKLFLHWFYTREGQTVYARNNRAVSVRKDVPQDYLPMDQRYVEGQKFMVADADDFTAEGSQRVTNLARKIFEKAKP